MIWRIILIALVALALAGAFLFGEPLSWFAQENLQAAATRLGPWGPVLIVGSMTLAIVASPIPSAPIALAAGAVYGHLVGTTLIVIGAEAGAMLAFLLARLLGRDVLQRWLGDRLDYGLLGSQNALTFAVFVTRLMPFVSFDLVSYAAGLSTLRFWRFALATLAGIIPASFLLAHFGNEVASADLGRATWAVLGLGLLTGAPLIWAAIHHHRRTRRNGSGPAREP